MRFVRGVAQRRRIGNPQVDLNGPGVPARTSLAHCRIAGGGICSAPHAPSPPALATATETPAAKRPTSAPTGSAPANERPRKTIDCGQDLRLLRHRSTSPRKNVTRSISSCAVSCLSRPVGMTEVVPGSISSMSSRPMRTMSLAFSTRTTSSGASLRTMPLCTWPPRVVIVIGS